MMTLLANPTHVLPVEQQVPTLRDPFGDGSFQFKRRQIRPLRRWEMVVPSTRDRTDPLVGFLDYLQGDTPVWFDGAGFCEIVEPIPIGIGNGSDTDFLLPHRYVYTATIVAYTNGSVDSTWFPLTDIVCDGIRYNPAPAANAILTAKYIRKAKVVIDTESPSRIERSFTSLDDRSQSVHRVRYVLQEVAI